jgi:hypothetical protein
MRTATVIKAAIGISTEILYALAIILAGFLTCLIIAQMP